MIKGGYYIKARCIQDSDIAHASPCVREMWDWILKETNHKDTKTCKRGQCIRTYKDIQEGLSWQVGWRKMTYKKHDCENTMKWLMKHTMITTMKTTRGLLITVLNYDKYQTPENYENHRITTTKATRKPQTTATINKNDKNDKNDNNPILQTSVCGNDINKIFDLFYEINPSINYGNITQRKATIWLIEKFGLENMVVMTERVINIQGEKYAPVVTSPLQLKNKLGDLKVYFDKQTNKTAFIS